MKILLAMAICAAWLQSSALADYYNPPADWSTKPHFTHQQWEFSTSANPAQAEPGYTNAAGPPSVQIRGDAFWINDPSAYVVTDRRGMWVVGGFTAPTTATQIFLIPNVGHNTSAIVRDDNSKHQPAGQRALCAGRSCNRHCQHTRTPRALSLGRMRTRVPLRNTSGIW